MRRRRRTRRHPQRLPVSSLDALVQREVYGRLCVAPKTAALRSLYTDIKQTAAHTAAVSPSLGAANVSKATQVKFDASGSLLAVAATNGTLAVYDFDGFLGKYTSLKDKYNMVTTSFPLSEKERLSMFAGPSVFSEPVVTVNTPSGRIESIAWSPHNENEIACAFAYARHIGLFDLGYCDNSPTTVLQSNAQGFYDVAYVGGQTEQVVAACSDGAVCIWDVRTNLKVRRGQLGKGSAFAIETSKQGQEIVSGHSWGLAKWDARMFGRPTRLMRFAAKTSLCGMDPSAWQSPVLSLAFDPSDSSALYLQFGSSAVGLVDVDTLAPRGIFHSDNSGQQAAIRPRLSISPRFSYLAVCPHVSVSSLNVVNFGETRDAASVMSLPGGYLEAISKDGDVMEAPPSFEVHPAQTSRRPVCCAWHPTVPLLVSALDDLSIAVLEHCSAPPCEAGPGAEPLFGVEGTGVEGEAGGVGSGEGGGGGGGGHGVFVIHDMDGGLPHSEPRPEAIHGRVSMQAPPRVVPRVDSAKLTQKKLTGFVVGGGGSGGGTNVQQQQRQRAQAQQQQQQQQQLVHAQAQQPQQQGAMEVDIVGVGGGSGGGGPENTSVNTSASDDNGGDGGTEGLAELAAGGGAADFWLEEISSDHSDVEVMERDERGGGGGGGGEGDSGLGDREEESRYDVADCGSQVLMFDDESASARRDRMLGAALARQQAGSVGVEPAQTPTTTTTTTTTTVTATTTTATTVGLAGVNGGDGGIQDEDDMLLFARLRAEGSATANAASGGQQPSHIGGRVVGDSSTGVGGGGMGSERAAERVGPAAVVPRQSVSLPSGLVEAHLPEFDLPMATTTTTTASTTAAAFAAPANSTTNTATSPPSATTPVMMPQRRRAIPDKLKVSPDKASSATFSSGSKGRKKGKGAAAGTTVIRNGVRVRSAVGSRSANPVVAARTWSARREQLLAENAAKRAALLAGVDDGGGVSVSGGAVGKTSAFDRHAEAGPAVTLLQPGTKRKRTGTTTKRRKSKGGGSRSSKLSKGKGKGSGKSGGGDIVARLLRASGSSTKGILSLGLTLDDSGSEGESGESGGSIDSCVSAGSGGGEAGEPKRARLGERQSKGGLSQRRSDVDGLGLASGRGMIVPLTVTGSDVSSGTSPPELSTGTTSTTSTASAAAPLTAHTRTAQGERTPGVNSCVGNGKLAIESLPLASTTSPAPSVESGADAEALFMDVGTKARNGNKTKSKRSKLKRRRVVTIDSSNSSSGGGGSESESEDEVRSRNHARSNKENLSSATTGGRRGGIESSDAHHSTSQHKHKHKDKSKAKSRPKSAKRTCLSADTDTPANATGISAALSAALPLASSSSTTATGKSKTKSKSKKSKPKAGKQTSISAFFGGGGGGS